MSKYVWLLMLLVLATPVQGAKDPEKAAFEALKGTELVLAPSVNGSRYVFGGPALGSAVMELKDDLFPLFADVAVTITKVKVSDDEIRLRVTNKAIGDGWLEFHAPAGGRRPTPTEVRRMIDLISLAPGDPRFLLSDVDGKVHFLGSDHCSPGEGGTTFVDEIDARAVGYPLCRACFNSNHRDAEIVDRQSLSRSLGNFIRSGYVLLESGEEWSRLDRVGRRVIENWMWPLDRDRYRFIILDSIGVEAFACPNGEIYLSSRLVELLSRDEMLAAIVAVQVSHVEFDHGLHQYDIALDDAAASGVIAGLIGGLATGDVGWGVAAGAGVGGSMAMAARNIIQKGYNERLESEADATALIFAEWSGGITSRESFLASLDRQAYYQSTFRAFENPKHVDPPIPFMNRRRTFVASVEIHSDQHGAPAQLTFRGDPAGSAQVFGRWSIDLATADVDDDMDYGVAGRYKTDFGFVVQIRPDAIISSGHDMGRVMVGAGRDGLDMKCTRSKRLIPHRHTLTTVVGQARNDRQFVEIGLGPVESIELKPVSESTDPY